MANGLSPVQFREELVEHVVENRCSITLLYVETAHDRFGASVSRRASSRSSLRAKSPKRQPARFDSCASASPIPEGAPMTAARIDCLFMPTRNRVGVEAVVSAAVRS